MNPDQIANLALSYAYGLRATITSLQKNVPPAELSVIAYLEMTALELETLAVAARDNDEEAIIQIFNLLGKPRPLTLDFHRATQNARNATKVKQAAEAENKTPTPFD